MINYEDITVIISTNNTYKILDLCLSSLNYYCPKLKNIILIDRFGDEETKNLSLNFRCKYIYLPHDNQYLFDREHGQSIDFAFPYIETKWVLLLHNDVEFINNIDDVLIELNNYDLIYTEEPKNYIINKSYFAPKTSFLLLKLDDIKQAKKENITFNSTFENQIYYDVFYHMWNWYKQNNKKITYFINNFYIHCRGYTNYRRNIMFQNDNNIKLYNEIIDKFLDIKIDYIKNCGFPIPQYIQKSYKKALMKDLNGDINVTEETI